ncbi:MAG: AMP-binding protein [Magnetococcus sp. YQC-5]
MTTIPFPGDANIAHWFDHSSSLHGSRPALYVDDKYYSYSELKHHALQIASAMQRLDPNPDNPIAAVFAHRSLTAYAAVLGILYSGKGYVPLNPNFPISRNLHIADTASAEILVVDGPCESMARELLEQMQKQLTVLLPDHTTCPSWTQTLTQHRFFLQDDIFASTSLLQEPHVPTHAIAYLLFTSGSTGTPKGIMVAPENVNAFVASMLERYQPTPEDRFSQHSDLTFDASVYDMFVCWGAGACLYPIPQTIRMAPARFIKEHALTFWESVPAVIAFMKRMYLLQPGAFPSLRWSVFGGEQLTCEAVRLWQAASPNTRIDNTYGPTEGTICITSYLWQPGQSETACLNGAVPIGTPYPGQTTAILVDGQLLVEQDGAKGELCLCGSQVTPGYWHNQAETQRSYFMLPDANGNMKRWYKTGDLVTWKNGVGLYYLDRVDRQLKIRGYRVELSEIEFVLRQVSQTDQVAVIGWPLSGENVTTVIGFVCGSKCSDTEILEECSKRLPYYMVPRQIHRLAQLPLNANGKTDLLQLRDLITLPT